MKAIKILTVLLLLTSIKLVACAGSFYSTYVKDYYYDLLPPSHEQNPLYDLSKVNPSYGDRMSFFRKKSKHLNIKEWHNYLKQRLTSKEIEVLFYGEKKTLMQRYKQVSKKIENNSFEKYLKYIEKQQKYVETYRDESLKKASKLIKKGENALKSESDDFLKLRYLFLTMRLNHYSQDYVETLALYNRYYPSLKDVNSIVVEWIDALRAGALQHLGKDVESNTLYAQILRNNETNAYLGYYDFKVTNDQEWNNLLNSTADDDRKAEFHFLRALKWDGSQLKEHKSIAKLAPKSIWFERLSRMIMQDLQRQLYKYTLSEYKTSKYTKENYQSYLSQKKYLFKTFSSLKEFSFFSLYSKLYLDAVEHKTLDIKEINALKKVAKGKEKVFVDVVVYLNEITKLIKTDSKSQQKAFVHLESLLKRLSKKEAYSLFAYTSHHMYEIYPKGSVEKLIAGLHSAPNNYIDSLVGNADVLKADDFETYIEKKQRASYYENQLFKRAMRELEKGDIAKILAILNIKNGNFKVADKYLKQVPKLNRKTRYNPFNVSLSGNNRKVKGIAKGYRQKDFVATMLKIGISIEKNPTSSMDHFLYANGLYNSSWFGNFPMSASLYRNTTYIENKENDSIIKILKEAKKEYELALKYATKSEFKAKIAYQLLKIKSNLLVLKALESKNYYSVRRETPKILKASSELKEAFNDYKSGYSQTKYGKEIIKSCVTFSYFK